MAYKKQLKDKDGNTIYPDVGLNLDDVVYSDDPEPIADYIDPASYSTTEHKTGGTWIDGKPIYRKVIEIPSAAAGAETRISVGIASSLVSNAWVKFGALKVPGTGIIPVFFHNPDATDYTTYIYFRATDTNLLLTVKMKNKAITGGFAVVEYTKTTD